MESLGIKILLITMVMTLSLTVQAEIYKWVDEHGNTHYGEKPPGDKKSKRIHVRPSSEPTSTNNAETKPATDTKTRLEKQQKLIRSLSEDRKQKRQQREKQQRREKQRIRNCAVAKDNLRRYESSSSVYKVDDKGNRITLPGSERDKSIRRARAEVKKWCGN